MKKLINYLLLMLLWFISCHKEGAFEEIIVFGESLTIHQNVCPSVTDAVKYTELWISEIGNSFDIGCETFSSMSTCGLLETWLNHPSHNHSWSPWCLHCSNLAFPGFFNFNTEVSKDKVLVEFFKRTDCVPVLESQYISLIIEKAKPSGRQQCFELLLASDKCMDETNEKEKIKLMAMALQKMKYEQKDVNGTCHLMVSIMRSCKYAPFEKEICQKLEDSVYGYTFRNLENGVYYIGFQDYHAEIIIKYAKQFLKEKNN